MNNLLSLQPYQLKSLYNTLSFNKTKDKMHMVLEPLQSMIQIALLSISPIGSKLTIQENLLYLQNPSIIQPLSRWYNSDKKDDLYFLFQVVKRFIKWYNPVQNKKSPVNMDLYQLITKMAIRGLNNLLKTYNSADSNAIIQVIHMYKNILESVDYNEIDKQYSDKSINIDEVFENITNLYNPQLISIIHNTLLIVEKEEDILAIGNYINGLNLIMNKHNKQIQNWIKVNLII
jgi:hypothetical protein